MVLKCWEPASIILQRKVSRNSRVAIPNFFNLQLFVIENAYLYLLASEKLFEYGTLFVRDSP